MTTTTKMKALYARFVKVTAEKYKDEPNVKDIIQANLERIAQDTYNQVVVGGVAYAESMLEDEVKFYEECQAERNKARKELELAA